VKQKNAIKIDQYKTMTSLNIFLYKKLDTLNYV